MKTTHPLILTLAILASTLSAETVVNFTGDDTGSSAPTLNFGAWSVDGADNVRTTGFSTDTLNSLPVATDGLPALFGGVWQRSVGGGATDVQPSVSLSISSGGAPQADRLSLRSERGTGFVNEIRGIFMTDISDQGTYTFSDTDSLSVTIDLGGNGGFTSLNMVVLSDSNYYISEAFQSGSSGTLTITDPDAQDWLLFDPTANNFGGITGESISGSTVSGGFASVDAVGFFFQKDSPASGSGSGTDRLDNFVVTATPTAIPEPGTVGVIAALAMIGFTFIRRSRLN